MGKDSIISREGDWYHVITYIQSRSCSLFHHCYCYLSTNRIIFFSIFHFRKLCIFLNSTFNSKKSWATYAPLRVIKLKSRERETELETESKQYNRYLVHDADTERDSGSTPSIPSMHRIGLEVFLSLIRVTQSYTVIGHSKCFRVS